MAKGIKGSNAPTTVKRFVSITPKVDEMANELIAEEGHSSFSEVVRAAIQLKYETMTRSKFYRGRATKNQSQAEARASEAEAEERAQVLVCQQLGGTISEDENGNKSCSYYTYIGRKRYEQKASIAFLTPQLLDTQYTPSKAAVEKLQKEGKVEYEV